MKHGWEYTTFENVIKPAKVDRCKDRTDLPILSITMRSGIVFQNDRFQKTIASKDTSDYKIVKDGQLVIAFPIDEGLIYTQDVADEGIMSPAYNIWDVDYSCLNRKFLNLYFHCPWAMNYYKSKLRGTTQRRRMIPKEDLLSMPIPIPPLSIQSKIVSELDGINGILEKKREQIKELDTLAQSIFYNMFGDPVNNERGWEVKKLGDVATSVNYGTSLPAIEGGEYKYLRMNNITYDGYLDLKDLKYITVPEKELEKCVVRRGDILFNRTNSKELIGKTTMFDLDEEMIVAGYIIRVRVDNEKVLPIYISRYMNTRYIKSYLSNLCKGAVNQANVNSKELRAIPLPLPPLPLQQAFAAKIEAIEKQKELVNRSIAEVETLLASRMQHYFEA